MNTTALPHVDYYQILKEAETSLYCNIVFMLFMRLHQLISTCSSRLAAAVGQYSKSLVAYAAAAD